VIVALMIFRAFADGRADRALWGSMCNTSNATSNTYKGSLNKMLLSWRMLPGDNAETAFDLYRGIDGEEETKINDQNIGYNQPTHTGYYLGSDLASDEEAWVAGGYTSGIVDITNDPVPYPQNDIIYDLLGRQVKNAASGIYIRDGKKFIIR
ncbi:MAG: hypothetical protein K2K05_03510, partial [Muribaculaceae bacterium]|nr:hypothetical protein [Muribaculaceae bacterium]